MVNSQKVDVLANIKEIIEEAKKGKMFILVDDEKRENEGDLVIPAQFADATAINFMAKHGRGLICLTLTKERVKKLRLPLMSLENGSRQGTAFTVSIEAREGITTGISAADRAQTIKVAIDHTKDAYDITTPGHVFPLEAKEGGVLVRAGHTEASVDIAKLAGLIPAGVICEIMNDDGTMARMDDLVKFAKIHNLKIATITDLISYRRISEKMITRELETTIKTKEYGIFKVIVYINELEGTEHIALIKGEIDPKKDILVRMHAENIFNDGFGDVFEGKDFYLQKSMKIISDEGSGVIVLLRDKNITTITDIINRRLNGEHMNPNNLLLKDYGIGAQILIDLGVKKMRLISNSKKNIVGLDGYNIQITGYKSISEE